MIDDEALICKKKKKKKKTALGKLQLKDANEIVTLIAFVIGCLWSVCYF